MAVGLTVGPTKPGGGVLTAKQAAAGPALGLFRGLDAVETCLFLNARCTHTLLY